MALSTKLKTYSAFEDGDLLTCKMERAKTETIIEFKKIIVTGVGKKQEFNPKVFAEFFDMHVKEIDGFYEDGDGKKKHFNTTTEPISKEDLTKFLGVSDIKDAIPFPYKEACVLSVYFGIEENIEEAKKNLADTLKQSSLTELK